MTAPTRAAERQDMRRTVAAFLDRHAGSPQVRAAMASEPGYDVALWRRAADELGLAAALVPERCGGLGLDFTDAAAVLEEFGRRVVPTPLPTTLVAAAVLARCRTPAADRLLTRIAEDGVPASVAVAEPVSGWGIEATTTTAKRAGEGWELRGAKAYVPHGAAVDVLLVVARDGDELGVYAVDGDQSGVVRRSRVTLDQTRRLAEIDLAGAPATRVHEAGAGSRVAHLLVDHCMVALAVESAAAARACLDMTVEYLKVRHQFGRPIGSFQALKHRCADLVVRVEGAVSTAWYAAAAAASGADELPLVAPLAKLVCADTLMAVAAEAVQMHGGIGFTFEHDAHLYLKRGKADQLLYGSGSQLRARLAGPAGM